MSIGVGDKVPGASLLRMGENGPEAVDLAERLKGRKVVIFALPGAFTGTCTTAHVPSYIRNMDALRAKGVEEVICVSVNDPFVMDAWSKATGADAAGITMLGDADASWTKAMGRAFSAPPVGLFDRSRRYAIAVEDGVVTVLKEEAEPGQCEISAGEAMVAAL